eukprot:7806926-Alexandrium_andersonii.AAC.1
MLGARGGRQPSVTNTAHAPSPHGCGEMLPEGADDVYVEVSLEPGITRVVFAFPTDGGWYACAEVNQFEV